MNFSSLEYSNPSFYRVRKRIKRDKSRREEAYYMVRDVLLPDVSQISFLPRKTRSEVSAHKRLYSSLDVTSCLSALRYTLFSPLALTWKLFFIQEW
jgi:peptide subunit release factor 1 (eRF1)